MNRFCCANTCKVCLPCLGCITSHFPFGLGHIYCKNFTFFGNKFFNYQELLAEICIWPNAPHNFDSSRHCGVRAFIEI